MPCWTKRARKDLENLPEKMRERARAACKALDANPHEGKKLKAKLKDLRSIRLGRGHRVIYKIQGSRVTIVTIVPRRDAYR